MCLSFYLDQSVINFIEINKLYKLQDNFWLIIYNFVVFYYKSGKLCLWHLYRFDKNDNNLCIKGNFQKNNNDNNN